ncbi:spore cortex biosynthesis protein YabQ [Oscillospiraceae bacterium LCP25S3_E10]|nr:spore cortex biosynthesis protein YabQ [Ruminococcus sp.]MDD6447817.1 spore cortex biosynthesis protein YabQ [Ruminococcus sp.]MDY2855582.1 spore cortex biosynthesis protein YabQ [Oscillospiraceae bacterium]
MELFISQQLYILFFSIITGVIIGIINEPFRFLRYMGFNGKAEVIVQDIVFMILAAFVTFFFALCYNKGDVRFFMLAGELGGFVVFRLTVGRLSGKLFYVMAFVLAKISAVFKRCFMLIVTIMCKAGDLILVKIPLFKKTDKTPCKSRKIYCIIIKNVSNFNRKIFKR